MKWHQLSTIQKWYYHLLLLNAILFILIYYIFIFRFTSNLYHGGNEHLAWAIMLKKVIHDHKILVLAAGLAIWRLYSIFIKKDKRHLMYDGWLLGGLGYAIAIFSLNLNFAYYYFPAIVLCYLIVIYWTLQLQKLQIITSVFICISLLLIIPRTIDQIRENQYARITIYPQMTTICQYIKNGYSIFWYRPQNIQEDQISTHLVINNWRKSTLEIYLNYITKKQFHNKISFSNQIHYPTLIFNSEEQSKTNDFTINMNKYHAVFWMKIDNVSIFECR